MYNAQAESDKNSTNKAPTVCSRSNPHFLFYNIETGEKLPSSCNTYKCDVCGPRKIRKFKKYLTLYLRQYKILRMWTFTLSTRYFSSPTEHYKALQECFRRLTIELRRNHIFSKTQHDFQYVKVLDVHVSGYIHFHCIFTEYFKQQQVQQIWESICQKFLKVDCHCAQSNVTGKVNHYKTVNYVTKYMTKSIRNLEGLFRKWSKSGRIAIFPKRNPESKWYYICTSIDFADNFANPLDLPFLTSSSIRVTSHELSELSRGSPPHESECEVMNADEARNSEVMKNEIALKHKVYSFKLCEFTTQSLLKPYIGLITKDLKVIKPESLLSEFKKIPIIYLKNITN
jgi:hypothetical protein